MTKEELKQIRIDMGLSQQKFADHLGIESSRTIRRYESGDWKVSNVVEKKLKKGLDGKGCPMV